VSSTFTDLQEERRLVSNSLAKAGYIAAGMELFPATDQDQFEYIKRIIDRSDYYVVITAGRYGSTASDGVSYTEKEFEYAKQKGIPVLALLHANPGSLASDKCEQSDIGRAKLKQFNEKLKTGRMTDFWSNKDELCTRAVIAVGNSVNLTPGLGWVRGDNAIDPKVLQEAERLRTENADLRSKIANLHGSLAVEFDPTIAGPDTAITVRMTESTHQRGVPGRPHEKDISFQTTFGELFQAIYDDLLLEPAEHRIGDIIGQSFPLSSPDPQVYFSYSCDGRDLITIRNQLEALGLTVSKAKTGSGGGTYIYWTATEKGRRYFASHSALKPASRPE
jgi:Domain of unknown function (DUF4062)